MRAASRQYFTCLVWLVCALLLVPNLMCAAEVNPKAFFEAHCYGCHDKDTHRGGLDLTSLKLDFSEPDNFCAG